MWRMWRIGIKVMTKAVMTGVVLFNTVIILDKIRK